MKLLLDTHILLWLMEGDSRMNRQARSLIEAADEVFVSSASFWELAIKARLGKLRVDMDRLGDRIVEAEIIELVVTNQHAIATMKLPRFHNDPFDRLLVAQAMTEPMRLVTADSQLCAYSELVILL